MRKKLKLFVITLTACFLIVGVWFFIYNKLSQNHGTNITAISRSGANGQKEAILAYEELKKEINQIIGILQQAPLQASLLNIYENKTKNFELLGVSKDITFEQALNMANYVGNMVGIRPAFLLGVLQEELTLEKNEMCYVTNFNTGVGIRLRDGKILPKTMSPRDVQGFLKITKELGKDPSKTLVTCPMSFGWGGAMGPADFIPSTWMAYKDKIEKITGKPADPWNIQDAFLAAGLYLSESGAKSKTNGGEYRAAMIYFSGSPNSPYSWYANGALALAKKIQANIDILEKSGYIESNIEKFKDTKKVDLDNTFGGVAPYHIPTTIPSRDSTMLFVGDIMLSRSVGALMDKRKNYNLSFINIAEFLRNADLTFGNLENPVSARGIKVGSKYSFRANPKTVEGLKFAGFDIVSIANNHIWDYGRDAFLDTLEHLKNSDISYVGGGVNSDEAHAGIIKNVNGTKIGFLAYTDLLSKNLSATLTTPGISFLELEQVKKDIVALKPLVDVLMISFHWGDEYQTTHNQKQEHIAKTAVDAGADLIIGHHPHVIQEIEQYKNGWIAYSLGNFVFDQMFSQETKRGLILEVIVSDGRIKSVNKKDITISNEYQPSLAE